MSGVTEAQRYSSNVLNAVTCPLMKKSFQDAQMLNCQENHSVSLAPAVKIFGGMKGKQCEIQTDCPLCNTRVSSYQPNRKLQELVDAVLTPKISQKPLETIDETKEDENIPSSLFDLEEIENDFYSAFRILKMKAANPSQISNIALFINRQTKSSQEKYLFRLDSPSSVIHTENFLFLKNRGIKVLEYGQGISFDTDEGEKFSKLIHLIEKSNRFTEKAADELKTFIAEVERGHPEQYESFSYQEK